MTVTSGGRDAWSAGALQGLLDSGFRDMVRRLDQLGRGHGQGADMRAKTLMLESLSPSQRATFETHNTFFVTGSAGGRYRLRPSFTGNVDEIDHDGAVKCCWCALPSSPMPIYDVLLAQRLLLESDEGAFLKVANRMANEFIGQVLLPPLKRTWRMRLRQVRLTHGIPSPIPLNAAACGLNLAVAIWQAFQGHIIGILMNAFVGGISGGFALQYWLDRRRTVHTNRMRAALEMATLRSLADPTTTP